MLCPPFSGAEMSVAGPGSCGGSLGSRSSAGAVGDTAAVAFMRAAQELPRSPQGPLPSTLRLSAQEGTTATGEGWEQGAEKRGGASLQTVM